MRLCAVSVDLDEIPNYFGIHGLAEPTGSAGTLVYDVAIDRLLTLARELEIPLTLFAIGSDLSPPGGGREAAHGPRGGVRDRQPLARPPLRPRAARARRDPAAGARGRERHRAGHRSRARGLSRARLHHHRRGLLGARRARRAVRLVRLPVSAVLGREGGGDRPHLAPRPHEPVDRRHAGGAHRADAPLPHRQAVLATGRGTRRAARAGDAADRACRSSGPA